MWIGGLIRLTEYNSGRFINIIIAFRWNEDPVAVSTIVSGVNEKPPLTRDNSILDADYIAKYLGQLSPLQESKLVQFRKKIEESSSRNAPDFQTLLRFLRARDFSIDKAASMLQESLQWREEHRIDDILSEYKTPIVIEKYFPGGWHHHDKDGRPLYILRLGNMDVKGLLKSVGEDELLKLVSCDLCALSGTVPPINHIRLISKT